MLKSVTAKILRLRDFKPLSWPYLLQKQNGVEAASSPDMAGSGWYGGGLVDQSNLPQAHCPGLPSKDWIPTTQFDLLVVTTLTLQPNSYRYVRFALGNAFHFRLMNAVNLVFTGLLLKNEVVSELMEAHLQLKKERGELLPARGFPLNNAI